MSEAIIRSGRFINNTQVINVYQNRYINNYIYVNYSLQTDIITSSTDWVVPDHDGNITVLVYGAGSGGNFEAGGSGGFLNTGEFDIPTGQHVPITIGTGGGSGQTMGTGGTTSFGTYLSANGGSQYDGGSTGGGNSNANAHLFGKGAFMRYTGNAGIWGGGGGGLFAFTSYYSNTRASNGGTYGGGGGACVIYEGWKDSRIVVGGLNMTNSIVNGGNGGTYGGGGAGYAKGNRGSHGGNGGYINGAGVAGTTYTGWFYNIFNSVNSPVSKGAQAGATGRFTENQYNGVDTDEFGTAKWIGGGGGGYGGRGGGSHAYVWHRTDYECFYEGGSLIVNRTFAYTDVVYAGGGGGGYCSNGGHARKNNHYQWVIDFVGGRDSTAYATYNRVAAGGGGGGYFGDGGNCGGGGGGYGISAKGGDGAMDNQPHDGYFHQGSEYILRVAGGGGGGYYGKGGEGIILTTYSGFTQVTASTFGIHGGGGGYGNGGSILENAGYGAGGCSYDWTVSSQSNGGNGICMIQYYKKV